MGSFSNGDAGQGFEEVWCERCIHYTEPDDPKQCAVWMLHLLYNDDQYAEGINRHGSHGPTTKRFLDALIVPTALDQECAMFVPRERVLGGISWCASLRHSQPMEDRNSGAPCLRCLAEEGVLHYADA